MEERRRTLFLVSLGCVKNRVDSEVMLGAAVRAGYELVTAPEQATTIVINTCGFIGDAKKESIDTILEMAEHKAAGTCERLVVAGCLSQRHPAELAEELPEVDHFLGSSDALALSSILRGNAERMLVGSPGAWVMGAADPRVLTTPKASAYVKIAEGCSRTCSFCIIPSLRGPQRSRPADDIVREVTELAQKGVLEVNLVSQDTVSYGRDLDGPARTDLAALVERIAEVPGIAWVRLLYLYPENITDPMVALLAQHPRVLPYIDMPLQHASDAMLRRMRRGHGGDRLRSMVERLRRDIPDLTFRTAFIVGHPGETEADFLELCDFVRFAAFEKMVAFRYSDEEGTRSFEQDEKVDEKVAESRYKKLLTIQRGISRKQQKKLVGRTLEVLVEGPSEEHDLVMMGRHRGQAPEVDGQVYLSGGPVEPSTLCTVTITQSSDYDLVGELLEPEGADGESAPKRRVVLPTLQGRQ